MAVEVSRWYDEVAVHASGASIKGMEQAIKSAIGEFMRESAAFTVELPGITLRENKDTYYIPPPQEGPIILLHAMFYQGRPLVPKTTLEWLHLPTPDAADAPIMFHADIADNSKIVIAPKPSVTLEDKLIPYVALGYSPTCRSSVPDVFCRQWYDVILDGALQRLMMQPNKPYTNAQMAIYHARRFRSGMFTARDRARKQFTQQETPFQFPKWA
jgi:hypothetical protein